MSKLLLVTGCSGSGKTRAAKYAEQKGAERYSIDDRMMSMARPIFGERIGPVINTLPRGDEFWDGFPNLTYTMDEATEVLDMHYDRLMSGDYEILTRDRHIIGAALFGQYFFDLQTSLNAGRDVVQEGGRWSSVAGDGGKRKESSRIHPVSCLLKVCLNYELTGACLTTRKGTLKQSSRLLTGFLGDSAVLQEVC